MRAAGYPRKILSALFNQRSATHSRHSLLNHEVFKPRVYYLNIRSCSKGTSDDTSGDHGEDKDGKQEGSKKSINSRLQEMAGQSKIDLSDPSVFRNSDRDKSSRKFSQGSYTDDEESGGFVWPKRGTRQRDANFDGDSGRPVKDEMSPPWQSSSERGFEWPRITRQRRAEMRASRREHKENQESINDRLMKMAMKENKSENKSVKNSEPKENTEIYTEEKIPNSDLTVLDGVHVELNSEEHSQTGKETRGDSQILNDSFSDRPPGILEELPSEIIMFEKWKRSQENYKKDQEMSQESQILTDSVSDMPSDFVAEFPSDVEMFQKWKRSQEKHSYRPKVDPKETSILLFPGQGAQFVGMANKLLPFPNVKEMFNIASGILGYDLLDLCVNGPKSELDKTAICQPAIYVTSLAAVEKLKEENPQSIEHCISAAGFSVGEYAALVFAGAISYEDGLELIKVRGKAMQHASNEVNSGMMTAFVAADGKLGLACHTASEYCRERLGIQDPVCTTANYLYPQCRVIAGHSEALDFLEQNGANFGIRRIKRLPVSGAFHTRLMQPAIKPLKEALKKVPISEPIIPVHSNVNSFKYRKPEVIRKLLVEQVVKPVKWEQTMHVLYSRQQGESFPFTFEVGPGKQLGTLLKMVNSKARNSYSKVTV